MNKRIVCIILSLVLLAGLLPFGTVQSYAASNTYSEDIVSLIKQFEGFQASAYADGSQWSIGYGTKGQKGQTITEEKADELLRAELDKISTAINTFASKNNLSFSQEQHDALVSFSFNCGTEWTTQSGRFRNAVVNGAGTQEFLFAISLWANVGGQPAAHLLKRRMAEADLYLNGRYEKNSSDYSYVIFNPNGGTPGSNGEDKMQGYDSVSGAEILVKNPTKSGVVFGGWFTAAAGGTAVDTLDWETAGKTLYAQYGKQVKVTSDYLNVRSGAGTNHDQVDTLYSGDTVVIVETDKVGDAMWGRCASGWIALENTNYSGGSISQDGSSGGFGTSGTTTANVNVRSGAGTNYGIVGSLLKGSAVTILETKTVNGVQWGRIGNSRWVCMTYVSTGSGSNGSIWEGGEGDNNGEYTYGTVTGSAVNVRKGAGLDQAVVGSVTKGDRVKIYEQTTVSNTPWGRTDKGWVCMNYVKLDASEREEEKKDDEVIASGVTTANLNVRSAAGTNNAIVGALTKGSKVEILEKTTVSGQSWGRIAANKWICLSYVTLDSESKEDPEESEDVEETGVVTASNLNVRTGAGTGYARVRYLAAGEKVTVYEKTTVSGQVWGRIGEGEWICLSYVKMDSEETSDGTAYWVSSKSGLNIRSGAGTGFTAVGSYAYGTNVTVLETKTVSGTKWGRTDRGWVCMSYLTSGSAGGAIWS